MLNVAQMVKLRIVSPQAHLKPLIETLYKFGAIQVEQSSMPELDRPLPSFEEISERLVRLRAVEKRLGISEAIAREDSSLSLEDALKQSEKIDLAALRAIDSELEEIKSGLEKAGARKAELEPFKNLKVSPQFLAKKEGMLKFAFFALKPQADASESVGRIREALYNYNHEITLAESEGKHYALLAFDRRFDEKVNMIVLKNASKVLPFPQGAGPSFAGDYAKAAEECKRLSARIAELGHKIENYKAAHQVQIVRLRKTLEAEAVKATLPVKFGRTKNLVVVEGWVLKNSAKGLEDRISKITGQSAIIEEQKTFEEPPSVLKNQANVRPFEFLIKFFSLPKFNEIDPTFFVALTFPLFFGMILGDIAYGAIALIIAIFLSRAAKNEFLKSISGMMMLSAISTIIFGAMYGEFLGIEIETSEVLEGFFHFAGIDASWLVQAIPHIPRMEEAGLAIVISLSLGLGALHLLLGFVLGALNNFSQGHTEHGIGKASWAVFEISAVVAALTAAMPPAFEGLGGGLLVRNIALVSAVLALIGIIKFEGGAAALEVFGLMSNVFSYLRLMALGLSAAILANLISRLIAAMDFAGISKMFTGEATFDVLQIVLLLGVILLFLIGHALSLALGLFESSIQSLRLEYVEFFSKFYKGGGKAFVPLRQT